MVDGMTTRGTTTGGEPGSADVDAAVTRWAAAAGPPAPVARPDRLPGSAVVRFLRGVLLGCAIGLPLLALALADEPADGLGTALVVLGLWLGGGILQRRQESRAGR